MVLPSLGNSPEATNSTVGRTLHSAWNAAATFSASASVACIVSHAVGSKCAMIETEIKRRKQSMGAGPKIDVRKENSVITATIGAAKAKEVYDIVFVTFDENHSTEVKRGENQGKTLVNACVVLEYDMLDSWSGEPANLRTFAFRSPADRVTVAAPSSCRSANTAKSSRPSA